MLSSPGPRNTRPFRGSVLPPFFGRQTSRQQQAEFFFSQPKGLGLSLVRVSAKSYQDNNGSLTTVPTYCPELETAKKAQALGARVWASSWTPPPAWKTNGAINGKPMAHLQPSHYADFAQSLATFATSMTAQGVPLFGISFQNEPDHEADWEGCMWTPQEMTTFIKDQLGPKLAAASPTTKIIAPDAASWGNLPSFADAMLADNIAKRLPRRRRHAPLWGRQSLLRAPANNNKEFWETEISQEHFPTDTPDPSMTSAITMLRMIHDHMTVANMNALALVGAHGYRQPDRRSGTAKSGVDPGRRHLQARLRARKLRRNSCVRAWCASGPLRAPPRISW